MSIPYAKGIHAYLCTQDEELDVGDSYEEFRAEDHVSVNVISARDYKRALGQISKNTREERMLRQILTIGFRTGLRLNEIMGLRHKDICDVTAVAGQRALTEAYLRPHEMLKLKNAQSRRMLPLDVLLTVQELRSLSDWRDEHAVGATDRHSGLLFSLPDGNFRNGTFET